MLVLHQVVALSHVGDSPVTGSRSGSVETSGRHLFRRAAMTTRNLLSAVNKRASLAYQGVVYSVQLTTDAPDT